MCKEEQAFARKLRGLRAEHKLSQAELAEAVDVSTATVSNWESGECMPRFDTSIALADLFGVSMDQLAGRA